MNQSLRFFPLLWIAGLLSSCATISRTSRIVQSEPDSIITRVVADGVLHRQIVRKSGPWRIHCIEIDVTRPDVNVISARAFDSLKGRETTSSIAKKNFRHGQSVLAAVNADFFNMETGENDLNQVIEGEIVKGVKKPLRAQFALGYSRTPYIEKLVFEGTTITSDARFAIDAVNTPKDSTVVVLNHSFLWEVFPQSR